MNRVTIQSRLIRSVAYNEHTETLHVWFRNGKHRVHPGISPSQASALIEAQSPGFYYSYYIRPREPLRYFAPVWIPRLLALFFAATLLILPV